MKKILEENKRKVFSLCIVPRSKAEKNYKQSQLMFKKAVSCIAQKLKIEDATSAIVRTKDTKTTHDWWDESNTGKMPYKGIIRDTCKIKKQQIYNKNIILIDDVYTKGINIAEDCLQLLLDLGAKNVILYVVAKTGG